MTGLILSGYDNQILLNKFCYGGYGHLYTVSRGLLSWAITSGETHSCLILAIGKFDHRAHARNAGQSLSFSGLIAPIIYLIKKIMIAAILVDDMEISIFFYLFYL